MKNGELSSWTEVKETPDATDTVAPEAREFASPAGEAIVSQASPEAWDRVRELALRQLDRFMSFEPKVLRGDEPDAIHDIRVASRRLQQVLNLLYPQPRPREVQRLRRRLRRCRRALGEVRNCDVLLERVERLLTRKRAARREVWTTLRHYLHERRAQSFQKALRKLSKLNLAVFYVQLKQCLTSNEAASFGAPSASGVHDRPAPESFYDRVTQALERGWKAFEAQIVLSHQDPRAPVIHGVRIATKRLRYLVEVIHEFGVPGSAETLGWLRQLQQHLGDWHDLQVLEQVMIEMIARPEFLRDHLDLAMGVERLIVANRGAKKNYEDKYLQISGSAGEFAGVKEWAGYVLASPSAAFAKA